MGEDWQKNFLLQQIKKGEQLNTVKMGMFDSIYLNIKCPHCGNESLIECQTKELDCILERYNVGDFIPDRFNYLDCIADCHNKKCTDWNNKKDGYVSGFGRMFYVRVFIKEGKLSGEYKVLNSEQNDEVSDTTGDDSSNVAGKQKG